MGGMHCEQEKNEYPVMLIVSKDVSMEIFWGEYKCRRKAQLG